MKVSTVEEAVKKEFEDVYEVFEEDNQGVEEVYEVSEENY